jgi:hypothetical protein
MGLGGAFLSDLTDLKRRGFPSGSKLMEIGAQQLSETFFQSETLDEIYGLFGLPRMDIGKPSADFAAATSSAKFWRSLGFDYATIDLDGSPGAIALDLNRDEAPAEMRGAFDLIVNTGTTEHLTNQENAFRVIHDLAKVGAVMHHDLPGGGLALTHGFFAYTPKFFLWLADANDYEILSFKTCSSGTSPVAQWIHNLNRDKGGGNFIDIAAVPDISLRVTLRKKKDQPFVTPLDIPISRLTSLLENPLRAIRRRTAGW